MTTKTVPVILLILMEDTREVRRRPFDGHCLPNFLVLQDDDLPGRLAKLDFDVPLTIATAAWALDVSRAVEFIPLDEWVREFGEEPAPENIVVTPSRQRIVVAQPVEYQWIRPT